MNQPESASTKEALRIIAEQIDDLSIALEGQAAMYAIAFEYLAEREEQQRNSELATFAFRLHTFLNTILDGVEKQAETIAELQDNLEALKKIPSITYQSK